jgi:hypothetical protein
MCAYFLLSPEVKCISSTSTAAATASKSFGILTSTNMSTSVFVDFGFNDFPADVGFDDIAFGYQTVDGRASSSAQSLVAIIRSWNYSWLGMVGIGNYSSTFYTVNKENVQKSLLQHLFEFGTIPSRSWSYFAGSKYCEYCHHPTIQMLIRTIRRERSSRQLNPRGLRPESIHSKRCEIPNRN